jgi:hypothetical protein
MKIEKEKAPFVLLSVEEIQTLPMPDTIAT